jgi:hypothetical protein
VGPHIGIHELCLGIFVPTLASVILPWDLCTCVKIVISALGSMLFFLRSMPLHWDKYHCLGIYDIMLDDGMNLHHHLVLYGPFLEGTLAFFDYLLRC